MTPVFYKKKQMASWVNRLEEGFIIVILWAMTLVTFANVIARFLGTNILWALELTGFLFAWLVLLGAPYCVKNSAHIGVDFLLQRFNPPMRRKITLFAGANCLVFSTIIMIGAWQFWLPFATDRAWYETEDIPMPAIGQFLAVWMNEGEYYEKIPRFLPYFCLPLGFSLLTFRFGQALWYVWQGKQNSLLAKTHEETS